MKCIYAYKYYNSYGRKQSVSTHFMLNHTVVYWAYKLIRRSFSINLDKINSDLTTETCQKSKDGRDISLLPPSFLSVKKTLTKVKPT